MGKVSLLSVAGLLAGVMWLWSADLGGAYSKIEEDFLSAPSTPAYIETIGTPATSQLPELDFATWFPGGGARAEETAAAWLEIEAAVAESRTSAGWATVCSLATAHAGGDRTDDPLVGALACSESTAVTGDQRLAIRLLGAQAAVALFTANVPGWGSGAVDGRQAELRLICETEILPRHGAAGDPIAGACNDVLDIPWRGGDAEATLGVLAAAYTAVANDLAARDSETAAQPAGLALAAASDAPGTGRPEPDGGDSAGGAPPADDPSADGGATAPAP